MSLPDLQLSAQNTGDYHIWHTLMLTKGSASIEACDESHEQYYEGLYANDNPLTPSIAYETSETVYLSFLVTNRGAAVPNDNVFLVVREGDVDKGSFTIHETGFQGNYYGCIEFDPGTFSAGEHTLTLILDPLNEIEEMLGGGEDNNEYTVVFNVVNGEINKPDLTLVCEETGFEGPAISLSKIIDDVLTVTNDFTSDDEIFVSYNITNITSINAGAFGWTLSVDGVEVYSNQTASLPGKVGNNFSTIPCALNLGRLDAGDHLIRITVDSKDDVAETSEVNNVFTLPFTVEQGTSAPPKYLLSSSWNQDEEFLYEYNKFTPGGFLTGCVAVANGQVLYYWADQGYDVHMTVNTSDSFTCTTDYLNTSETTNLTVTSANMEEFCGITLEALNENLATITFDNPDYDEDDDIASLLVAGMMIEKAQAHGVFNGTAYSYDVTTAPLNKKILQRAGFVSNYISNFTAATWNTIQSNVIAGKPALASSATLGHVLVVDGYDANTGNYHLNFGWGNIQKEYDGNYGCYVGNGWYNAAELEALNMNYAVVDIAPAAHYSKSFDKGDVVDGSAMKEMIQDTGKKIGGFTLSIAGKKMFVPISLKADNIKVCVMGNLEEQKLVFAESSNGEEYDSFDVKKTLEADNKAVEFKAVKDNIADVFLARASIEKWSDGYIAKNNGYIADNDSLVAGTNDTIELEGRNKICDVFTGSDDPSVLILTDDACGDALFVDDIFSESGHSTKEAARIAKVNDIYAGAGNDVIDMTSKRFKYEGTGMTLHGGDGDDVLWSNKGSNVLCGDAGNDWLVGARNCDEIFIGGTGNDTLNGVSGNNVFCFGDTWGQDTLLQAEGTATLVFADGLADYAWNEEERSFTCGENSLTVDPLSGATLTVYVGANRIYGAGEITYNDYKDYCENQDTSSTLAVI